MGKKGVHFCSVLFWKNIAVWELGQWEIPQNPRQSTTNHAMTEPSLDIPWPSSLHTYRGATWTSLCFKNKLIKHRSAPQRGQTHHCVSPGSQLGEYPKSCFYFSSPTPKTLYSYFSPLAVCLRKMDRFLHTRLSLATIICWRFQEISFLFPASPHQSEPS